MVFIPEPLLGSCFSGFFVDVFHGNDPVDGLIVGAPPRGTGAFSTKRYTQQQRFTWGWDKFYSNLAAFGRGSALGSDGRSIRGAHGPGAHSRLRSWNCG